MSFLSLQKIIKTYKKRENASKTSFDNLLQTETAKTCYLFQNIDKFTADKCLEPHIFIFPALIFQKCLTHPCRLMSQ